MTEPGIRYARTDDGIDIAFAMAGSGPPLLVLRQYMAPDVHEELAAPGASPVAVPWWLELGEEHTIALFDWRGTGLSSPGPEQSLESGLADMRAVVRATGLTSFDIIGALTPAHFAVAYAAADPGRVRRMALWNPGHAGGSMRNLWARWNLPNIEMTHFEEYAQLAALKIYGWERAAAARRFAEMMLERYTAESWMRLNEAIETIDATAYAPQVQCPCLVLLDHNAANDALVSPARLQHMRRLAAAIPNAQLSIVKRGETRAAVEQIRSFLAVPNAQAVAFEPPLPSGTAIILYADIADHTALIGRIGDAAFREQARPLDEALRRAVRSQGGTVVDGKTLGDGILATFPAASQAIAAAFELEAAASNAGLGLHIGLHAGDVLREVDADGRSNVFGGAVNVAARISALAPPGEVLVSATVRDLGRTSSGVTFEDRGEHALKGIAEAQRVYAVRALEAD